MLFFYFTIDVALISPGYIFDMPWSQGSSLLPPCTVCDIRFLAQRVPHYCYCRRIYIESMHVLVLAC